MSSLSLNFHHFTWIILIGPLPTTVDSFAQKPERILKNISQVKLLLSSKSSSGFILLVEQNPNSSPWRYKPSIVWLLTAFLTSFPTTPAHTLTSCSPKFCSSLNMPGSFLPWGLCMCWLFSKTLCSTVFISLLYSGLKILPWWPYPEQFFSSFRTHFFLVLIITWPVC